MKKKTICFDIDNVICKKNKEKNYKLSIPIKKNIKVINELYDLNFEIIIYTARYMGRFNGNSKKAENKIKPLTVKQLKQWGVKYNQIFFGKPSFDFFVDDKSIFFDKNWSAMIKKILNI